jgi:DNA invertase Pin-like site-specific DNA recombinase
MNHGSEENGIPQKVYRSIERSPEVHRENAEKIINLHSQGYSIGEIALHSGLSRSYIRSVMDILHLKRGHMAKGLRGPDRQRAKDLIRDLRLQGMSSVYIGRKLNITRGVVTSLIQELRNEGRLPKEAIPYTQEAEIADSLRDLTV